MMVGGPGRVMLLATKPVVSVPVVANTGYAPEIPFAVNGVAVATPEPLVVIVTVLVPLAKVPLAPVDGAVKVTGVPGIGTPKGSCNVTLKGVANPVPTTALWSDPSVGSSWLAPPGWMVSVKGLIRVVAPECTWTVKEPGIPLAVSTEEVISPAESEVVA